MQGSQNFSFNNEQQEYVVTIRGNGHKKLLLLLLLLPLILLLKFNKQIDVKTVNGESDEKIVGADVTVKYQYRRFVKFSPFGFFTCDTVVTSGQTGEDGVCEINAEYTLFSRLFYTGDTATLTACEGCMLSDTTTKFFHALLPTEILKLEAKSYDITFRVIDADDNSPLPDAEVIARTVDGNKSWKEISDADGYVCLQKVPYCAQIELTGSHQSYINDTISGEIADLIKEPQKRNLVLKPGNGAISFMVKDLYNEMAVAGAKAQLINENGTQTEITVNTDGEGKGGFDSIGYKSKFKIKVTHHYYHDTVTDLFQVDKYMKMSDDKRIIYIRPLTRTVIFRNLTDEETGKPLPGVSNDIYINGKKTATVISNNQGVFQVGNVKPDDKISIIAKKPGYNTNNYTVKNKKISEISDNQAKRDILLNFNPPMPQNKPTLHCGVHFSGTLLSDVAVEGHISKIYQPDKYGEYVADGKYPSNQKAFPNAVRFTFDAIAVNKGTHLIIYSLPNFKGQILLDVKGPALINNVKWKDEERIKNFTKKTFSEDFENLFPKSCRQWSINNMNQWDYGSSEITCDE